jgi:ribosome-binding factor A
MKRKKPSRKDFLSSCSEVGPDDGADPRTFFRKTSEKKLNRKALQLCSEVAKSLRSSLAWELGDDLLSELLVESVVPAPDSTRVLVTVSLLAPAGTIQPADVLERLRQFTGRLRAQVGAAIHRRRVPELSYRVEVRWEVEQ